MEQNKVSEIKDRLARVGTLELDLEQYKRQIKVVERELMHERVNAFLSVNHYDEEDYKLEDLRSYKDDLAQLKRVDDSLEECMKQKPDGWEAVLDKMKDVPLSQKDRFREDVKRLCPFPLEAVEPTEVVKQTKKRPREERVASWNKSTACWEAFVRAEKDWLIAVEKKHKDQDEDLAEMMEAKERWIHAHDEACEP